MFGKVISSFFAFLSLVFLQINSQLVDQLVGYMFVETRNQGFIEPEHRRRKRR